MSRVFEWLLGLDRIRLDAAEPLTLRLLSPPAPWMLLAGAVLLLTIVGLAYALEPVRGRTRAVLAACRISAVLVIMAIASRPALVLSRNLIDPSVVAVLLDDSTSMQAPNESASPQRRADLSRWKAAVEALAADDGLLARLTRRHRVELWRFAESAELLARFERGAPIPPLDALRTRQPDGRQTDVDAAVATILERTRGARLATIVVVSDGRQTTLPSTDEVTLRIASERHVALHAVSLGSADPYRDVAIQSVAADPDAFVGDVIAVSVRLAARGIAAPTPVLVELRHQSTGELLAARKVTLPAGITETDVELFFKAPRAEALAMQAVIAPDVDDETRNNVAVATIDVHDATIRVLYVDALPRFEYRYLKNAILREPSFKSSILLLSAARGFPQEGTHPVRRFPTSPEELRPYDVILLGDVDPRDDWISPPQLRLLEEFVSVHGGGLGFIAGEHAMPFRLRRTPLEKFLPIRIDPLFFGRYEHPLTQAFHPRPTHAGRTHPLLRLDPDLSHEDRGDRADAELLASLSGWYWYAQVAGPAPGAEVLLEHESAAGAEGPIPLAVLGRYGAGRTYYHGTDDTWRWRRDRGEAAYDAYWVRVIRLLARNRKFGADSRWRLEVDRRDALVGEPVHFRLTAVDPALGGSVSRVIAQIASATGEPLDTLPLGRVATEFARFEAEYWPREAGAIVASVEPPDYSVRDRPLRAHVSVSAPDFEHRDPSADHVRLQRLAHRTGGRIVTADACRELADQIPDQSVAVPNDIVEPLWDTRLAIFAFLIPLTIEWVLRRSKGLT